MSLKIKGISCYYELCSIHTCKIFAIIIYLFGLLALHEELDGKKDVVVFDFLGKDSIRYYNSVPVSVISYGV